MTDNRSHRLAAVWSSLFLLTALAGSAPTAGADVHAAPSHPIRSQIDTVGFATRWSDMEAVIAACRETEGPSVTAKRQELGLGEDDGWIAAIMPHDDYLYAGRVALHVLPGLKAGRWLVFGVCHACRRVGVRDRLVFDSYAVWRVAGEDFAVDTSLRSRLLAALDSTEAVTDRQRHAEEHSIEALLPWLKGGNPDAVFVPILVPGMSWSRMMDLADRLSSILAGICVDEGWLPGRDLGILISSDAVHYGCEDWRSGGYHPFGCNETGHAAAVVQDLTVATAILPGALNDDGLARFVQLVWNPDLSEHPTDPYLITWCGLYSIPFGLATAHRLQTAMDGPPLRGHLLRYGDSYSDGRLTVSGTRLGVTAPNHVRHWVGYLAAGYTARP